MTSKRKPGAADAGSVQGPADFVPFDLAGPLPRGVTLLEASAGTGKTFAIAGLVARYVAEGIPLAAQAAPSTPMIPVGPS